MSTIILSDRELFLKLTYDLCVREDGIDLLFPIFCATTNPGHCT